MNRIILTAAVFALVANASAQLKVDANGQVGIGTASPQYKLDVTGSTRLAGNVYLGSTSNILGTTNNAPITFKVNGVLSGYTGSSNKADVSFGYGALYSNTWNDNANTAIGYAALCCNTAGSNNTASGSYALYSNTTGHYNTASGNSALSSNITGCYNTAIGHNTLPDNVTGHHNTAIGHNADVYDIDQNNSTAIGYYATATSSNQVRIGSSLVTSIGGYAAWTNLSDKRAKKNIRADVPGLDFINRLQPVTYNLDLDAIDGLLKVGRRTEKGDKEEEGLQPDTYNLDLDNADGLPKIDKPKIPGEDELPQELKDINKKAREAKEKQLQTGFIAQDVEATAKSIGYDFSGVDVDEIGIYGLRYAEFVVPLVKAVQELSEQNDRLQETVQELSEQNERLQMQVDELTGLVYRLQEKEAAAESRNANKLSTGVQAVAGSGASLQQNSPNPFSQDTQIKFYLPQNIRTASLNIYDLQGKQLKQLVLNQRGEGSQMISGSEFAAGIYLYALIADGREVDVKRMVLTE